MDEIFENQVVEETADDGREGVVDPQEVDEEVEEEGGEEEREEGENPEVAERERVRQSHEDNAAAKAARIRAERDTEQSLRKQYDERVSGMGIVNPYTGKPLADFTDFEQYAQRYQKENDAREAKKQGKTPEEIVEERENRAYIQRKRQEEAQADRARQESEQRAQFMRDDLSAFMGLHPDVDVAKLESNPKFRKFAGKRLYQEPLTGLYDDFVELVGETERAATVKAASKQQRATGSGGGGESAGLTPAQERTLEAWNQENPHMKMTPKEYLGK